MAQVAPMSVADSDKCRIRVTSPNQDWSACAVTKEEHTAQPQLKNIVTPFLLKRREESRASLPATRTAASVP